MHPAVEAYLLDLDESARELGFRLRQAIMEAAPQMEEKYAYLIPFYYYHGPFCYLNKKGKGIYIAFVRGKDLVDEYGLLTGLDLKQVRHYYVDRDHPINEEALRTYLQQALMLKGGWNIQRSR